MKNLLVLSILALFGTAVVRAEVSRADLVDRVETCEAILQEFQSRPDTAVPAAVLQKARALIIVNQFKAGLFFGIKDGRSEEHTSELQALTNLVCRLLP